MYPCWIYILLNEFWNRRSKLRSGIPRRTCSPWWLTILRSCSIVSIGNACGPLLQVSLSLLTSSPRFLPIFELMVKTAYILEYAVFIYEKCYLYKSYNKKREGERGERKLWDAINGVMERNREKKSCINFCMNKVLLNSPYSAMQ